MKHPNSSGLIGVESIVCDSRFKLFVHGRVCPFAEMWSFDSDVLKPQ